MTLESPASVAAVSDRRVSSASSNPLALPTRQRGAPSKPPRLFFYNAARHPPALSLLMHWQTATERRRYNKTTFRRFRTPPVSAAVCNPGPPPSRRLDGFSPYKISRVTPATVGRDAVEPLPKSQPPLKA